MPNPEPKEVAYASTSIGGPFPPNPVKCPVEQNIHVALWYKHGKPIYGCARNNGGVVECSFPYETVELKGPKDVGGNIQVLQYIDDHRTQGFWYNWIAYKERLDKQASERQLVPRCPCCGRMDRIALPCSATWTPQQRSAGSRKTARQIQVSGKDLDGMLIIVRELRGGPPSCTCPECPRKAVPN